MIYFILYSASLAFKFNFFNDIIVICRLFLINIILFKKNYNFNIKIKLNIKYIKYLKKY